MNEESYILIRKLTDNGLAPKRRQAITRTNAAQVHGRIYAALGGDALAHWPLEDLEMTLKVQTPNTWV